MADSVSKEVDRMVCSLRSEQQGLWAGRAVLLLNRTATSHGLCFAQVPLRCCQSLQHAVIHCPASVTLPHAAVPIPSAPRMQDALFLGKLLLVAFVGGATIKYGSLLIDLPFQPNAAAAWTIVLMPPVVWAAQALVRRS